MNIIEKETKRQDEILIGCPEMCRKHKSKYLEHKRVLINLKEYIEKDLHFFKQLRKLRVRDEQTTFPEEEKIKEKLIEIEELKVLIGNYK